MPHIDIYVHESLLERIFSQSELQNIMISLHDSYPEQICYSSLFGNTKDLKDRDKERRRFKPVS